MPGSRSHWDSVYGAREEDRLTWFEPAPELSMRLIGAHAAPDEAVIDIGGGVSRLVDHLLAAGWRDITVLDLSPAALATSRERLGPAAEAVDWIATDITVWEPDRQFDLWHDRAAFHFLTDAADRAAYLGVLDRALAPGGRAILMSFAEDGPETCSGLPVRRYSPESLAAEIDRYLPGGFDALAGGRHVHLTPTGKTQTFQYSVFRRHEEDRP